MFKKVKKTMVYLTIGGLMLGALLPAAWQVPVQADEGPDMGIENPFPKEFGFLRIGTPICADISKVNYQANAFDMGALDKAGFLLKDQNSTGGHSIMGNGYDKKSQDAWGASLATELGLKTGFVDATAKFHMSKQENSCHASSAQHISAVAWGKSAILLKKGLTEDQLLSCATQDFRDKMAAIRKARNNDELKRALDEFYRVYGTGFVSALELGNYGVFVGTANYKSDSDEEKYNVGAGVNVSAIYGGASVAGEYSTQNMNAKAEGSFVAKDFSMPDGSPPGAWVNGFTKQFAGAQLAKLANLDAWSKSYEAQMAKNDPVTIKPRDPEKKPLDDYKVKDFGDAIKKMKMERFEKEYMKKHNGKKPTIEDYEKWLKEVQNRAKQNENQINRRHSVGLSDEDGAATLMAAGGEYDYSASDSLGLGAYYSSVSPDFYRNPLDYPPRNLQEGDISLGSYGITGYTYVPWSEYFPKLLGFEQSLSSSQYVMGFATSWLAIRRNIGQYFNFCTNYSKVAPESINANAIAYEKSLQQMTEDLLKILASGNYDENIDKQLEAMFQEKLKNNRFTLFKHYQMIIDNYDWLKEMPAGAVPVYAPGPDAKFKFYYYLTNNGEQKRLTSPGDSPAPRLVKDDAVRLFPIIAFDNAGKPVFAWVGTRVFVNNETKKETLGTYSIEIPYDGSPMPLLFYKLFGMLFMPLDRAGALKFAAATPNLLPDRTTLENSYWTMKYADKEGKSPNAILFIQKNQCTDVCAIIGHNPVPEKKAPDTEYDLGSMVLVPIDYAAIELAGGKLPGGGIPMWGESNAGDFVAKLNQLSKVNIALDLGEFDLDEDIEDGEFDIYMSKVIDRLRDKADGENSASGLSWTLLDDYSDGVSASILARIAEKTETEERAMQARLQSLSIGAKDAPAVRDALNDLAPDLALIEELAQELARIATLDEEDGKEKAEKDLAEKIGQAKLAAVLDRLDATLTGNLPGGGQGLLPLYQAYLEKNLPFEHQSTRGVYDLYRYMAGRQIQAALLLNEYYHYQDEMSDDNLPNRPDYPKLAVANVADLVKQLDNQGDLLPSALQEDINETLQTKRGEISGSKVRLNADDSVWFIADSDFAIDANYLFLGIDGPMPGPLNPDDPDGPMPGPIPDPTPDPPGPMPGPVPSPSPAPPGPINISGLGVGQLLASAGEIQPPMVPSRKANAYYLAMPGPIDINDEEEKELSYQRDTEGLQVLSGQWQLVETAEALEKLLAKRDDGQSGREFFRDNCDVAGLPSWVYLDILDMELGATDGTQHVYNIEENYEESFEYRVMLEVFGDRKIALIYRQK